MNRTRPTDRQLAFVLTAATALLVAGAALLVLVAEAAA